MTREMGKVHAPRPGGDVQEAIDMSYYMAGEGRRLFGQTTPSELPDKFNMSVRMPIGVVGVITPWNFPIAIPSWKIVPALVCGNTVVFKPADGHAGARRALRRAARRGGRPRRRRQRRPRLRRATSATRLVRHPDVPVDHAHRLARDRRRGARRPPPTHLKHVHLELGGKNAIIVMDDADLDLAVEGIVWSAFGTSGQRCTAASRVIVHEQVYDALAVDARRGGRAAAARPGLGGRHRRRPGDQPRGAREDPLATRRSARTRARSC